MGRSSLLVGNLKKKYAQGFLTEKLPQQDHTTTTDSEMEEPYLQGTHTVVGLRSSGVGRRAGLTLPFSRCLWRNPEQGPSNVPSHRTFPQHLLCLSPCRIETEVRAFCLSSNHTVSEFHLLQELLPSSRSEGHDSTMQVFPPFAFSRA